MILIFILIFIIITYLILLKIIIQRERFIGELCDALEDFVATDGWVNCEGDILLRKAEETGIWKP